MVSFPPSLSSPQKATLRTSGYWSRVLTCLNDNEVLWQARANQTITSAPFIAFAWDNETIGSYADVVEGLVVYISSTTDLRDFKYRGYVRLAPSSNTFYISYNSTLLNDGDYISVVVDDDLFTKHRNDTLLDDGVAYHALPPVLTGLPSAIVLYDADHNGTEEYTPSQTGIPVDVLATTVDTWAWFVLGGGTSSIDDPTLEHPTITFEAGYHYLLRVEYTDDNGVSNYQMSHVYCVTRTFDAPVVQPIVTGSIEGGDTDGWTASVIAYGDVAGILDRTHAAIFHVQHFGDDSSTPIVSNVLMNGRIRSSSIKTEGNAEAGQVQEVSFTIEGITAYMRRLRLPNDIIRAVASPDEWGEITDPNPFRMAVYAMWTYSTLTNIGSFGVESGAFSDWTIGGEPRGIDGGYTIDVLENILSPIHAAPNYAPDGEIYLAVNVNYKQDRSGVPLVTAFTLDDLRDYNIDLDSSSIVSQVTAYGGSYDSTLNDFVIYSANAPTVVYLEGETRELNREILTIDASVDDARNELKQRASDHYAFENSKPLMSLSLFDSYAGVIIPTNFQRWAAVLPASSNTLERAWTDTDYWLLQSVSLTINTDGSIDVSGQWPAETTFDDAQAQATLLPINLDGMNPVLPILANDPAFPTDASENYPTDFPTLNERQPIDPFSGMMAYTPWPPDVAARAAARQSGAGCKSMVPPVNFRTDGNVTSSWTTVLNDPYVMTVSGSAKVVDAGWYHTLDLTTSDGGLSPRGGIWMGAYGTYVAGVGWQATDANVAGGLRRSLNVEISLPTATYTYGKITYDYTRGTWDLPGAQAIGMVLDLTLNTLFFGASDPLSDGTDKTISGGGLYDADGFSVFITASVGHTDGSATLTRLDLAGEGTNPFTGDMGGAVYADAFYTWQLDEDDEITNVQLNTTGGLYLDNSSVVVPPPFSENHTYTIPFTGTGNVLLARFEDTDYTDNQSALLYIEVCPKDA